MDRVRGQLCAGCRIWFVPLIPLAPVCAGLGVGRLDRGGWAYGVEAGICYEEAVGSAAGKRAEKLSVVRSAVLLVNGFVRDVLQKFLKVSLKGSVG